jgi:hypothetical protein
MIHNKVKKKSNAIRAGLSYDLPRKLLFELYAFTVDMINMVLKKYEDLMSGKDVDKNNLDRKPYELVF